MRLSREEIIQNIKDCGQSLIDNAEKIVGNYRYLGDIVITCYVNEDDEPPRIFAENCFVPEKYIERNN